MSSAGPLIVRTQFLRDLHSNKLAQSGRRCLAAVSPLWAQIECVDASLSGAEDLAWQELLSPPAWRAASSLRDALAMAIELANARDRQTTGHTLVTSRRDYLGNTLG